MSPVFPFQQILMYLWPVFGVLISLGFAVSAFIFLKGRPNAWSWLFLIGNIFLVLSSILRVIAQFKTQISHQEYAQISMLFSIGQIVFFLGSILSVAGILAIATSFSQMVRRLNHSM